MKRRLRRLFYNLICLTGQPCARAGIQGNIEFFAWVPAFAGKAVFKQRLFKQRLSDQITTSL
jgi:hypothetical protein